MKEKCQWCGKTKKNSLGICDHCHRFPQHQPTEKEIEEKLKEK
jgi:predicted ATP-dependent serine protease